MWLQQVKPWLSGSLLRRYKDGELQRLLYGNRHRLFATMQLAIKRVVPKELIGEAVTAMLTSRVFTTLGAKYLWAYLRMTDFSPGTQITHEDFVIFSITLRLRLPVTAKTLKRYITEAYKAIQAAGHKLIHPRTCGIFSIIQGLPIPKGRKCRRGLDYCGIQWQHIRLWRKEMEYPTQQDMVAITIISIAFTSLWRVGTFLPVSLRLVKDFS